MVDGVWVRGEVEVKMREGGEAGEWTRRCSGNELR
jgi:hypothetical protein